MKALEEGSRYRKEFRKVANVPRHRKDIHHILNHVTSMLRSGTPMPERFKDHQLERMTGHRECHLKPDLLLIYKPEKGVVRLARIGSHSDLYSKNFQVLGV